MKLMTKIIRRQQPCLLIKEMITDQEIYDAFSNNKRKFKLRNTDKMMSHNKKKLNYRVRSLLNHFYALDQKLIEDLLNCQNSQQIQFCILYGIF